MSISHLARTAALIVATACASAGGTTGGTARNASEITAAQIAEAKVTTAYDAVDRLARRWFRDMSTGASGTVAVYLDPNQLLGGPETLRDIPAGDVVRIRYLNSADATPRYGAAASGGAIIVTRR